MKQFEIPNGYELYKKIDLAKDTKVAILVNAISLLIAFVVGVIGVVIIVSQNLLLNINISPVDVILLFGAIILYITLHEAIHGICFKIFSGKWGNFGYKFLYFYAGSKAFYKKREYLIIGLAPIVLFGIIFLLLNIFLPPSKFIFFYILQIINLSGGAGDLYIAILMKKLPKDAIFRDHGISIEIYLPNKTSNMC